MEKPVSSSNHQVRDISDFSESLRLVLNQITINEVPRVVGSSAFVTHKYPSDVDVFEQVTVILSREQALNFYCDQFKNIMQQIMVNWKDVYYNDFKAGEDQRFDIEIPKNIIQRKNIAQSLYDKGILSKEEATELFRAANDIDEFQEIIRNYRVLRWTPQEVIKGIKKLPGGAEITFREALSMNTLVKLDVISWIYGRFQSIEVFYNLRYTEDGKIVEFYPLGSYRKSLIDDIQKYSSRRFYSPLKVAKRLWSLSRVIDCTELQLALNPLLRSDAAALNQISSDAEVLNDFIQNRLPENEVTHVFLEILAFHKRAANHLNTETYPIFEKLIDSAFPLWIEWQTTGYFNRPAIHKILDEIQSILKPTIVELSENFLRKLESMNISCRNPKFTQPTGVEFKSIYS